MNLLLCLLHLHFLQRNVLFLRSCLVLLSGDTRSIRQWHLLQPHQGPVLHRQTWVIIFWTLCMHVPELGFFWCFASAHVQQRRTNVVFKDEGQHIATNGSITPIWGNHHTNNIAYIEMNPKFIHVSSSNASIKAIPECTGLSEYLRACIHPARVRILLKFITWFVLNFICIRTNVEFFYTSDNASCLINIVYYGKVLACRVC